MMMDFNHKFEDHMELLAYIFENPVYLDFLVKKYVSQGDSLDLISAEISEDRNLIVKAFLVEPTLETKFFEAVDSLSMTESDKIKAQAIPAALRQLNDLICARTKGDLKDMVTASRAILAYDMAKRRGTEKDDPFEEMFKESQRLKNGPAKPTSETDT
jgi:hypothetical protein